MKKRLIYFNEFNLKMSGRAYLPLVSGSLVAYAMTDPVIRDAYEVAPFLFAREPLQTILAHYTREPDVAAFSVSLWNEQLSLAVARAIKTRWPRCLVVFGGCQIPFDAQSYLAQHSCVDVCARGEGEQTFLEILRSHLSGLVVDVPGTTTRRGLAKDGTGPKELDVYPSPYLTGQFDALLEAHPEIEWQAIIETNRGCPFSCVFCWWANALNQKYRLFSLERCEANLRWCADRHIRYIFNADSNFGMLPRDREIVQALIHTKLETGYPEKFRTCWGKNSDEKIYTLAYQLHEAGLDKGLTLARQSQDPETLKAIKRTNIRLSAYAGLQRRANADGVPVYTELILGLPGETEESFKRGVEECLSSGLTNQLFIYHAELLPSTPMSEPAYREQYGIQSARIPLRPIHTLAQEGLVEEYDEIVIGTAAMPPDAWRRLTVWSWVVQVCHGMKLLYFLMEYTHQVFGWPLTRWADELMTWDGPVWAEQRAHLERQAEAMQRGEPKGQHLPAWGAVYWEEEEAVFLRLQDQREAWEVELEALAVRVGGGAMREVAKYQASRIPCLSQYDGDRERYAREVILFGRKSGTNLVPDPTPGGSAP